jgi:hypothetical protein
MLAARAFMMLFLYNSATSTKVPPPVKFLLRFQRLMASSNSCIPFTAMLILAKLKQPLLYILHVKYR